MQLVFLGSPPFGTPILEALIESGRHRPAAVVTPPDRPLGRGRKLHESELAHLAQEAGLELLRPEKARDPAFLERLRELEPDVCLVASYGELLTQEFLDIPNRAPLNVHPSLLPRHRGASPIQAALLAGDRITGVSVQRVVLKLDAGDILHALETEIQPGETAGELAERLAALGGRATLEALDMLDQGKDTYTVQDEERVTLCRKLEKAQGRLDWSRPAIELERQVRALNPWPGAFTVLPGDKRLFVHRAAVREGLTGAPGELLEAGPRLVVATGEGTLELLEVQAAGKRALDAEAFLRGARLAVGQELGA